MVNGVEEREAMINITREAELGKITEDEALKYTILGRIFKATRPWQPYKKFATNEWIEQDYTLVEHFTDGFTPWADILGAVFYGGGAPPFLLGLGDGLWDSRKAKLKATEIIENIYKKYPIDIEGLKKLAETEELNQIRNLYARHLIDYHLYDTEVNYRGG